ncbi:MAG TPA: O-sialoglycoprotein endopeptidase [Eubacteriales bacterium]|nr:O-sialoglycoprotein endopeptidase [Eubacteriales bacterium]
MSRLFLGVDTSAYTTSICCVCEEGIVFEKRTMLSVPLGGRGLRQSEALFQHVKNLPALTDELFHSIDAGSVCAAAVSAKPTAAEDSYMPVFLAGKLAASSITGALGVPLYETTHQAGHVRAAMFGNEAHITENGTFLAMHISGGTTDLLRVGLAGGKIETIEKAGGCADLHAGQFVDRVGVKLGLSFPSGPELEKLAVQAKTRDIRLPSSVKNAECSFSGQETAALRMLEQGAPKEEIAFAVYDCMARTFSKILLYAMERTGCETALLSGGVSGSGLLRTLLQKRTKKALLFARTGLSSDNAAGTALLAKDLYEAGERGR